MAEGRLAALRDKDAGKAMAALAALPGKYADNVRVDYANLQAARIAAADKDNPEPAAAAAEVAEYERNFRQSLSHKAPSPWNPKPVNTPRRSPLSKRHPFATNSTCSNTCSSPPRWMRPWANLERQTRALEELRHEAVAVSPTGSLPAVRIIEQAHGAKLPIGAQSAVSVSGLLSPRGPWDHFCSSPSRAACAAGADFYQHPT